MSPISRRDLLTKAAPVAGLFAFSKPADSEALPSTTVDEKKRKLKIIVTGGHPGDPEYGCGGTIARFTAPGHAVSLLYLNEGEPHGTLAAAKGIRVEEAKGACAILKSEPLFAGQIDGSAIVDSSHYAEFRTILEASQPNAVFTHWPIDNHGDHRAISMLTYDAWIRMGRKFALYFYEVSNGEDTLQFAPTHYVDITSVIEQKHSACLAHASQAPEKFFPLQQSVTHFRGLESGHKEAEAFIRHIQSPPFELP